MGSVATTSEQVEAAQLRDEIARLEKCLEHFNRAHLDQIAGLERKVSVQNATIAHLRTALADKHAERWWALASQVQAAQSHLEPKDAFALASAHADEACGKRIKHPLDDS